MQNCRYTQIYICGTFKNSIFKIIFRFLFSFIYWLRHSTIKSLGLRIKIIANFIIQLVYMLDLFVLCVMGLARSAGKASTQYIFRFGIRPIVCTLSTYNGGTLSVLAAFTNVARKIHLNFRLFFVIHISGNLPWIIIDALCNLIGF